MRNAPYDDERDDENVGEIGAWRVYEHIHAQLDNERSIYDSYSRILNEEDENRTGFWWLLPVLLILGLCSIPFWYDPSHATDEPEPATYYETENPWTERP